MPASSPCPRRFAPGDLESVQPAHDTEERQLQEVSEVVGCRALGTRRVPHHPVTCSSRPGPVQEPNDPRLEASDEGDHSKSASERRTSLRIVDIDAPEVRPDDVLVRVHAAALNPADWHILRGDPYVARLMGIGLTKPKIPVVGSDAAGVVEAVGANVRGLQPGDEVFGFVRGAFAEYACAAQDQVVPKPASLTFEQAAALPIAATTALRGIRDVGEVKAGQRVLVNGAGGGVGSLRGPDRGGDRRRGHGRVQHGQRRAGALARRRARHRLHGGGLHGRRRSGTT